MNYYNPYFFASPALYQTGGISNLFQRLSLSSILNGTQRTLNLINQALPLIKEAAPMMKNARTMFKVMNEFKKIDTPIKKNPETETSENKTLNYGGPTFFA